MKLKTVFVCMMVLAAVLPGVRAGAEETPVLKTSMDKVSYATGVELAKSFKRQGLDINSNVLLKGMKDTLSGEKLLMTEEELRTTMVEFQTELKRKYAQARKEAAERKRQASSKPNTAP